MKQRDRNLTLGILGGVATGMILSVPMLWTTFSRGHTTPDTITQIQVPEQAGYVGVDFKDLTVWILEDAGCDR